MEKRYQVFVSSTFDDLHDERQQVMQALLELDCIPAGMELFPAANEDQWSLIKKVIDDCDYYLVISAGRYGSIGPDGVGYSEMEYRYALQTAKPIIGFLHKNPAQLPGTRCEATDFGKAKLEEFRSLLRQKMVRFWDTADDLGSQVSRSLIKLIKNEPAVGWIKADSLPSEDITRDLLALRKRIDELERELQQARFSAPTGSEDLAQGEDTFCIEASFKAELGADEWGKITYGFEAKWNEIFSAVAPAMIDEVSDSKFRQILTAFVHSIGLRVLNNDDDIKTYEPELYSWEISDSDFQTVKVQLRALGLIVKSAKARSVRNTNTYWTLTPLGDELMTRLRAVKKGD